MQGRALYQGMVMPPMPGVHKQLSGHEKKTGFSKWITRLRFGITSHVVKSFPREG